MGLHHHSYDPLVTVGMEVMKSNDSSPDKKQFSTFYYETFVSPNGSIV